MNVNRLMNVNMNVNRFIPNRQKLETESINR